MTSVILRFTLVVSLCVAVMHTRSAPRDMDDQASAPLKAFAKIDPKLAKLLAAAKKGNAESKAYPEQWASQEEWVNEEAGTTEQDGHVKETEPTEEAGAAQEDWASEEVGTVKEEWASEEAGTLKDDLARVEAGPVKDEWANEEAGPTEEAVNTEEDGAMKEADMLRDEEHELRVRKQIGVQGGGGGDIKWTEVQDKPHKMNTNNGRRNDDKFNLRSYKQLLKKISKILRLASKDIVIA